MTPGYTSYMNARLRCNRVKHHNYKYYGGRGIQFRYPSFDAFLADVGPKPTPKHELDRIDTNGHYEVGNCRWVTKHENLRNTRANKVSTKDLPKIFRWAAAGVTQNTIAMMIGCTGRNIGYILRGQTWWSVDVKCI